MKRPIFLAAILICTGSLILTQQSRAQKVTKIWETPAQLTTCESVCFNPSKNEFYVSNINGNPSEKDGMGFIAVLSEKGEIKNLNWITGLNAPKGMGVYQDNLYVADLDQVVEISISEGKVSSTYKLTDNNSLNDIAVGDHGTVYISSPQENSVYRLKNGQAEKWIALEGYNGPNGIFAEGNILLIGVQDNIIKVSIDDQSIEEYITNTGGIDGLEAFGNEYYIISDWMGKTHLVHPEKEKVILTDTTPEGNVNAADIEYVMDQHVLVIPTFFHNTVAAYTIEK